MIPSIYAELYFSQQADARVKRLNGLRRTITPETVRTAARIADTWPNLPAAAVAAAAFAAPGIDPASPLLAELSRRQTSSEVLSEISDRVAGTAGAISGVVAGPEAIKGTLRGGMTLWDALWNEAVARPFKTVIGTLGLTDQGPMNPFEAWKMAGASYGTEAIARMLRDPIGNLTPAASRPDAEVNLGSGIMPRSDPTMLRNGRPVDDISALGMAQTSQLTRNRLPITPGRFLIDELTPLQPDTGPYNLFSGAIDAGIMLAADPAAIGLKSFAAAGRASRTFTAAAGGAIRAEELGGHVPAVIYRLGRRIFDRPTAEGVFSSAQGASYGALFDAAAAEFRANPASPLLARIVDELAKKAPGVDVNNFISRLIKGGEGNRGVDLFIEGVNRGQIGEIPFQTGRVSRALGGVVGGEFGSQVGLRRSLRLWGEDLSPGLDRTFREMSAPKINVERPAEGMFQLNNVLHNMGFTAEQRSPYLSRWAQAPATEPEAFLPIYRDAVTEFMGRVRTSWDDANLSGPSRRALDQQLDQLQAIFGHHDFSEIAENRKYQLTSLGDPAFFVGTNMQIVGDVAKVRPTAMMSGEMLERSIPTMDARMVRRALSPTRQKAVAALPEWAFQSPLGNYIGQTAINTFMTQFWKPLALIRVAWYPRIAIDEQMRMITKGLDTIFTDPKEAVAFMMDPDSTNIWNRAFRRLGIEPAGHVNALAMIDDATARGITPEMMQITFGRTYRDSMASRYGEGLLGLEHMSGWSDQWLNVLRADPAYPAGMAGLMLNDIDDALLRR
ncbi:MAG: hypothetical protein NUV49_01865, partial [Patescibacteria group bacterium]|nr:hypothetical protein [Patescibacteria group bacterium]